MGRRPTNRSCRLANCTEKSRTRGLCPTHYKKWQRAYGELRCWWPACEAHQHDGITRPRMHPRRAPYGRRGKLLDGQKIWLCQQHESALLKLTPEMEQQNLNRLAAGIQPGLAGPDGLCWIYSDGRTTEAGYQMITPEGAGSAEWFAHRALYGLLVGGHEHPRQLDHRCRVAACINPAHLEPVTSSENSRRRGNKPLPHLPHIAALPAVLEFATAHGLPHPTGCAHTHARAA